MTIQIITTLILVVFALTVIFVRLKAAKYPTSAKKILMPPIGMSTGFLMFLFPATRSPWSHVLIALLCGVVLSWPLVATSKMYAEDGYVYLRRSKGFAILLLALLCVRLLLHQYIEKYVTIPETAGLFFILAFGMILPWRLVMYIRYRKLAVSAAAAQEQM